MTLDDFYTHIGLVYGPPPPAPERRVDKVFGPHRVAVTEEQVCNGIIRAEAAKLGVTLGTWGPNVDSYRRWHRGQQ